MEIMERVMNLGNLKEKMNSLKRKMEVLESREGDITEELEYAESLSLKKPKKVVQTWLKHVRILKNEVQQMDQQVQQTGWGMSNFTLPNDVDGLAMRATELFQNGNFAEGLTLEAYGSRGVSLLTRHLVGGEFEKNKNNICQWLQSIEGSSVGVYGMGGVGKTTLLTHIHNQLQNLPNTSVSWVTVSQNFSIFELQKSIAKTVGLELSNEKEERIRAAELAGALSGRKKLVLILDDVWEYIPADKVGIPIGANGFKLILSTRSSKVCERMNCQRTIKVQPLSPEEAWELFLETLVLETSLTSEIEAIAEGLVENCDGLPLGIVTMAGCMKGVDDICEWRNALERMEESKAAKEYMETEVFRVLKYSYDNLKETTVQQCFLYCSLFPEDWEIGRDELIEYLIDERLIDEGNSRQAKFDRGHTILNKLENVCLLEGGKFPGDRYNRRYVKMHDLIRDMAIQVTSVSPRFLVKAGVGLEDIPEDEMWSEDLVRVSLMMNYIVSLPSNASPRCPRLSTLLLNDNWTERIPDTYQLVVGDCDFEFWNDYFERDVYMNKSSISKSTLILRKDIQFLDIENCDEITCLCDASLENAILLKVCMIVNCKGMKHLFCSSCCRLPLLQTLQELYLYDLPNLNDLMEGGTSITSTPSNCIFHSLKEFRVYRCHNMKRLFMPWLLSHLQNLETLGVEYCEQMEEIIGEASNEDEDQEATRIIVLPKLKCLILDNLPELENFCSTSIVRSNSLEEIYVLGCPKLRRMPLLCEEPNPLPSLQKINVEEEWWESLQWDHPQTKDLYQPFCHFWR